MWYFKTTYCLRNVVEWYLNNDQEKCLRHRSYLPCNDVAHILARHGNYAKSTFNADKRRKIRYVEHNKNMVNELHLEHNSI